MNSRSTFMLICTLLLSFVPTTVSHCRDETLAEPSTKQEASLRLSTQFVGTYSRSGPPTSFEWDGHIYDGTTVIDVLMRVILDRESGASQQRRAIRLLEVLEHELQDRDCIEQLLTLYSQLRDRSEKAAILACLSASEDPRALATFSQVLTTEEDKVMRLFAASGLARWNIRAGVGELLALLECNVHLPGRRSSIVKDEASSILMDLNSPKGWGFPRREVAKPAGKGGKAKWFTMVPKDCNDWFKANKERFPEWKPGDPLPGASSGRNNKPSNE